MATQSEPPTDLERIELVLMHLTELERVLSEPPSGATGKLARLHATSLHLGFAKKGVDELLTAIKEKQCVSS